MEDFPELPILSPSQSLEVISSSSLSRAQKLLASSLVSQARSFEYATVDSKHTLLILDVTHFLNHRINTKLIEAIGEELAEAISIFSPSLILTAPSSGNIPAIATALHLPGKPDVIFAPKSMPITMTDVYQAKNRSYTHEKTVDLTVAKDCLPEGATVAICDDFLDTGKTALDLITITDQALARVVTLFFVIEKPFGGRQKLIDAGFSTEQIVSLITIDSLRPGKLKLKGFDSWFELIRK